MAERFELVAPYQPTGDQPEAIAKLTDGFREGLPAQILLGVTGSGKTFTMANIIANLQRPTLVLAHNKTLAGQLCAEFRAFFPHNAVEYFVSYYDFYRPEAYIAATDTYIEKDSAINDEIDRLRHSATASLLQRRDVIVVASVSCIYGLGDPYTYQHLMVHLRTGQQMDRDQLIDALVQVQYQRNDYESKRGTFRVRGDVLDIYPVSSDRMVVRVSFFGDEIEQIRELDALTGRVLADRSYVMLYPASHYATSKQKILGALGEIEQELQERIAVLRDEGKVVEAYRLEQRTRYDMEMLLETGFVKGIENYSRFFDGRKPGVPPYTLLDFFPEDYLLFVDESHETISQVGAMYAGDRSRKQSLVDFGFRLPSSFDNRPLKFSEFEARMGQTLFVSATPAEYEKRHSAAQVEQVIRPTGLLDPQISIRPTEGQIEDLIASIQEVVSRKERALVLTLTKKNAEDFALFLREAGLRVQYLHSDIVTEERQKILKNLRLGSFDVLIGINLLREGIDLPEVSFIAILEADQKGFLRSFTSLIQMIGRAARNKNGLVVLYADEITDAMQEAVLETNRRREIQEAYNEKHGIVPSTIVKEIRADLDTYAKVEEEDPPRRGKRGRIQSGSIRSTARRQGMCATRNETAQDGEIPWESTDLLETSKGAEVLSQEDLESLRKLYLQKMEEAAKTLRFEEAAEYRDRLQALEEDAKAH